MRDAQARHTWGRSSMHYCMESESPARRRRGGEGEKMSTLTHGYARRNSRSKAYTNYIGMISRCHGSKKSGGYKWYRAKGISVCPRWRKSFVNFLKDMGVAPPGHTLDRINVSGDYKPSNCRWATRSQQQRNKTNSVFVEYRGLRLSLADWADRLGIKRCTMRQRLANWPISRAVNEPRSERHHRNARAAVAALRGGG